ncbi:hypothetical protein GQ457_07G011400 [Hibiscus cannabinus]
MACNLKQVLLCFQHCSGCLVVYLFVFTGGRGVRRCGILLCIVFDHAFLCGRVVRQMSRVGWSIVCRLKRLGGLGVVDLHLQN